MATLTEGRHPAECLISEANGCRSRDTGTLILGQNLKAGTVLGKITASDKLTQYDSTAGDGSETVFGILFDNVDATNADVTGVVVIVRDAEVHQFALEWIDAANETAGLPQLESLGIIGRD